MSHDMTLLPTAYDILVKVSADRKLQNDVLCLQSFEKKYEVEKPFAQLVGVKRAVICGMLPVNEPQC